MKILMVPTSHDRLGNTGRRTGFWLEEFAAPYFVFRDAGVDQSRWVECTGGRIGSDSGNFLIIRFPRRTWVSLTRRSPVTSSRVVKGPEIGSVIW